MATEYVDFEKLPKELCPFCGGRALIVHGMQDSWVGCVCGAKGPARSSDEEAEEAWNNRAIIQQQVRPDKSGKCAYPKAFIVCSWFDAGLCKSPDGICRLSKCWMDSLAVYPPMATRPTSNGRNDGYKGKPNNRMQRKYMRGFA